MKWRKGGLIYCPTGELWWAKSYAHIPTAHIVSDAVLRVYFASLDEHHFGRIGYVDLDADDPRRILHVAQEPVLDLGVLGAFDDSGVVPSCVMDIGEDKYLYYIGWQRCERVPYMLFGGLAIMQRGGSLFERYSRVPVLDRTAAEPFLRSAQFVLQDDGIYRMWYTSTTAWSSHDGALHYNNVLRSTHSDDGIHWNNPAPICLEPDHPDDYAVGRPWVLKQNQDYKMWYSIRRHRAPTYRMGYAESPDGLTWERKDDEVGIAPSDAGWDSEMVCYPCVIDLKGQRYMFYNGNRHGSTGFGFAVLES